MIIVHVSIANTMCVVIIIIFFNNIYFCLITIQIKLQSAVQLNSIFQNPFNRVYSILIQDNYGKVHLLHFQLAKEVLDQPMESSTKECKHT